MVSNTTHSNYHYVKNQAVSICPNCNKEVYVDPDEEKYFKCDKCGNNKKYVPFEIIKNTCSSCKWSYRSYCSLHVDKCYYNSGKRPEDFNEHSYDNIDFRYVCDFFQ